MSGILKWFKRTEPQPSTKSSLSPLGNHEPIDDNSRRGLNPYQVPWSQDAKASLDDFGDLVSLYGMDKDRLATQVRVLDSNNPKEIENEKGGMKLKSIIKYLQSLTVNPG